MAEMINGVSIQDRVPMRFFPFHGDEIPFDGVTVASVVRKNTEGHAWLFNPWTGKMRDPRDIASDVYGMAIVPPDGCGDDHKAFSCRASILDLIHLVEKSTCRFMSEADGEYAEKAICRIRDYLNMGVMPKQGEERLLEHPARVGTVVFGAGTPERFVIESAVRAFHMTKENSPKTNSNWVNFLRVQAAADAIRERIDEAWIELCEMRGTNGIGKVFDEFVAVLGGEWPPTDMFYAVELIQDDEVKIVHSADGTVDLTANGIQMKLSVDAYEKMVNHPALGGGEQDGNDEAEFSGEPK